MHKQDDELNPEMQPEEINYSKKESQLRYDIHPQSYNKEQYSKEVYNKEQYKESGTFSRELQSSYSREYKELATPFLVTDILEEPCRDIYSLSYHNFILFKGSDYEE